MVDSLQAHLLTMPYKDLRGLATRLGLRQRLHARKDEWIALITAGWQQPAQQQAWLHALSPAASQAIGRLLQAEQLPAALFWGEYGPVRQVTATQQWSPPPWQAPTTVSEELYYSGLLAPADAPTLARARWLALPTDLHPPLAIHIGSGSVDQPSRGAVGPLFCPPTSLSPVPSAPPLPPAWPLCHDVGQSLIYLHSQPELRLQQGRWLTHRQVAALNERLWAPRVSVRLPGHRHSPYLRLLSCLAEVGELYHQGGLTPNGWTWLAATPAAQRAWLWQAWCTATPSQRQRYGLPAATVGAPWPQPLLRQLQAVATQPSFTAPELVDGLLRHDNTGAAFWAANFQRLSALDQTVAQTLVENLVPFGIVAADAQRPDVYQVTPTGAALLAQQPSPSPIDAPSRLPNGKAPFTEHPSPATAGVIPTWGCLGDGATATCWLDLSALPSPATLHTQAQLVLYGTYALPPARSPQAYHRYQFTAATLAQAAAAGYGLPNLLTTLAQAGLLLTPAQQAQLTAWHAQGRQLTLIQALLLRTTTPAQLAEISQRHALQPVLAEILAPTVALIRTDPATFAAQLQRQGYYVAAPATHPAAQGENSAPNPATSAALWLAGRLYAHLGDHLALPLPPPFAELDRLLASLSPTQQAVLQAQAAQMHQHLLTLLDNLAFTPPPHPSDPAQWREQLIVAIDTGVRLQLVYFSAGRNLTTQRLIDPYWIEEHHTIPYLRAYCHSAGRVLTFRLDRIAALEPVAGETVRQSTAG